MFDTKQICKLVLFLFLFSLSTTIAKGGDTIPKNTKSILKLGLWHTKSTQGRYGQEYTNNIALNLLSGKSKNEYGFAISGIASIVHNNATGVQITGIHSRIDNRGRGLFISGLHGMINQYNGVVIVGGFGTVAKMRGVQVGLFTGSADLKGVQIGFFNGTGSLTGGQIGFSNLVKDLSGVQIGVLNERKNAGGVQIGILNIAPRGDYPIGLVNIMREDGRLRLGLQFDDRTSTKIVFRSGGKYTYGIIGLGFNFKSSNNLMAAELGYGIHWHLSSRFRTDVEAVLGWMIKPYTVAGYRNSSGAYVNDRRADYHSIFNTKLRVLPTFKLNDRYEVFAGPSLNYMQTKDATNVHLFPERLSLWKHHNNNRIQQIYVGYVAGVNYYF